MDVNSHLYIISSLILYISTSSGASCPRELEVLSRTAWEVKIKSNDTLDIYNIRLCGTVSLAGCEHSAVCRRRGINTAVSLGNYTDSLDYKKIASSGESHLVFTGAPCPLSSGELYKTSFILKCGKSLGSPDLLASYACVTYFEWYTDAVCSVVPEGVNEVPCSVYDDGGNKHDLSPLIKQTGGYLVNDDEQQRSFYINVCRDITPDSATSGCEGSASCSKPTSGQPTKYGSAVSPLIINKDKNLVLEYMSSSKSSDCPNGLNTTVTFRCPKRGGNKDPLLLSDMGCHYIVEWRTEYACSVDYLSTNQCKFSDDVHDVNFDLTPLKRNGVDHNYEVKVHDPQDNSDYTYYLNICGPLNIPCNGTSAQADPYAAVCQTKGDNLAKIAGSVRQQTLRYSDGDLTLTYQGGAPCHNTFQRETVIHFHCNKTAGAGQPIFETESHCTYIFSWDTQYACLDHPLTSQCRVDYKSKRFDLSSLVRIQGDNWEALNGRHNHNKDSGAMFYINICNDVLKHGKTANCPPGAACMIDHLGKAVSIGKYVEDPTYDDKSNVIKLHYKDGASCSDGKSKESVITFVCRPGDLESAPVLIRKSDDNCLFEFEWHTAAACVLGQKRGKGCRVFDDTAGFSFDLSALTKKGDKAFYKVPYQKYDYFINVCNQVKGTPCDSDPHKDAGGCQVERTGQHIYNVGKANGQLTYFDGMINLTYTDGEKYGTGVSRKMEIAFLCDHTANSSTPEFVEESMGTYFFKWYTHHACPEEPVECVVIDKKNHMQYDLSSLSMSEDQENWSVMDESNPSSKRRFYINVCRPVNPVVIGGKSLCDSQAATCMTSLNEGTVETQSIPNAGRSHSPPHIDGDGLVLEYKSGDECTETTGIKSVYSTQLRLRCKKGKLSSGPRFIEQVNNCMFVFLWETEAACPVDTSESDTTEDCTVKDHNSEYIFNMQPLRKVKGEDYTVQGNAGSSYRINVCGPIAQSSSECPATGNSPVSVCQVDSARKQHHLGSLSKKLEFSDDGQLTLTYSGPRLDNGEKVKVVITFLCRKDIQLGSPTFVRRDGNTYLFNFETALACAPEPVDCFVSDKQGNQYDLSPLARTEGAWAVVDTRPDHKDLFYFINVCRPINKVNNGSGASCPGGPIGGCQVNNNGVAYNMGYIQAAPAAARDGSLSIRYLNGEICHKGTTLESHRSTRINFFCSPKESDPSFEGETSACEYVFNWRTPSACPLKRQVGKDCKVTEPLYNQQFDLTPLQSASAPYMVKYDKYTFQLDVCRNIRSGMQDCSNAGVCQTWKVGSKSNYVNAGQATDKLVYEDGSLSLTYTGGKPCHNRKFNRTTIIKFTCDQKKYGSDGPIYLNETSDCKYLFEWPTSKACAPFSISECSVKDSRGNEYDLSSLTLTNDSYFMTTPQHPHIKYVLNVCSSIVHRTGTACPLNSAACQINTTETDPKKKYKNLGMLPSNPLTVERHHLVLKYTNGDRCDNGQNSSTIITLNCDDSLDSRPSFLYHENNCDYHFIWYTKAACPVNTPAPKPVIGNCKAKNPKTGYEFDLSSLKSSAGYKVKGADNHEFNINVCGPVSTSDCNGVAHNKCSSNTASCQKDLNSNSCFDAGKANSNLKFTEGVLTLNYTDGTVCSHNKRARSTFISFVCGPEGRGNGSPVFVDESDDCTYYVAWHTELACETEVSCGVLGSENLDLSPLIKDDGYHLAVSAASRSTDSDVSYYINICRPLNPIPGKLCPPLASACRVKSGETPTSIGHVHRPPFLDEDSGKVTIVYTHGSPCPGHEGVNMSSRIEFVCMPGPNKGVPELVDVVDGCQYLFTWETNVVCAQSGPVVSDNCTFYDKKTKHEFDFSALKQTASNLDNGYKVAVGEIAYYINICSPVIDFTSDNCKNSAVCRRDNKKVETSFGSSAKSWFEIVENRVRLSYRDGATCSDSTDGHAKSQIIFECDRTATSGTKPILLSSSTCDVVFRWPTILACPPAIEECVFQYSGDKYDLRLLSRVTSSWPLKDSKNNKYWLNICQGVHDGPSSTGCPPSAAVCRQSPDGQVEMLGQTETQQMTMDADGETLVLTYSEGNNACSRNKRRSSNVAARTVIKLQCANTVGGPQFVPSKTNEDNCVFNFIWKTSIACKNKRSEIQEVDGFITDPKSKTKLNLKRIFADKIHDILEVRGSDYYHYLVNLNGGLKLDGTNCAGSAICQTKAGQPQFHRNIAETKRRKIYIEDDVLEIVYESADKCHHLKDQFVTSQIDVQCDQDGDDKPTFLYESHGCDYVFQWLTPAMCVKPDVVNPSAVPNNNKPDSHDDNSSVSGGMSASTVAAIVAVFLGFIFLGLLLVVFHKQERRTAFRLKLKSIFSPRTSNPHRYEYSKLLSGEDDVLMNNMAAESSESSALVTSYHDDSDVDMLL